MTPWGDSTNAAGCDPYIPTITLAYGGGRFICAPYVSEGTRVKGVPSGCLDSGMGARLIDSGNSVWACVPFASVTRGDALAFSNSPQEAGANLACQARGFGSEWWTPGGNVGTFVRCKSDPKLADTVSDPIAQTKLDVLGGKLDTLNASTVANKPVAGSSSGTFSMDTQQYGTGLFVLIGGLVLILLLLAAVAGMKAMRGGA